MTTPISLSRPPEGRQASKYGIFGAFSLELAVKRKPRVALKSAVGTLVGFMAGTLIKVNFILIMSGFFVASWF
jgi:uncharacterized protein YqgC (DUF456 family)